MAGDIFFTDARAWSASSNGFIDIVLRAIGKCRANEDPLVQILSDAEQIRCLSINLQEDRGLQVALTERVLEAAQDKLQELREHRDSHPEDIRIIAELVSTSRAHLSELGSGSA